MIYFKDNFLNKTLFDELNSKLINFKKIDMEGGCVLYVVKSTEELTSYFEKEIERIEGKSIEMIMCGFRRSKHDEDNEWRIHSDLKVHQDQKSNPERAGVLYMSEVPEDVKSKLNGTAFWDHKEYGDNNEGSLEIHNKALEVCDDLSKWTLKSIIGHKPNRFLSYDSNYFHSKYPNVTKEDRIVCVMFYRYKNE